MRKLYNKVWDDPHYEGLMANPGWLEFITEDHDIELAKHIKSIITSDARISIPDRNNLHVNVTQGVVHLDGTVKDAYSMECAYRDAMGFNEDIEIVNNIGIKQTQSPNNGRVQRKMIQTTMRR